MKRRWLSGGTRDGQRIAFECDELPKTVILDGDAYRLTEPNRPQSAEQAPRLGK